MRNYKEKKYWMTDCGKKYVALLLVLVLIITAGVYSPLPVMAEQVPASIEVATKEEFLSALDGNYQCIVVTKSITVSNGADGTGKMLPVEIPGGVTICGGEGISLDFRCPVQIAGNNVVIKDVELLFSSGTALGSVPHREIFLAGHSLTLDGVKTYLEGSGGALGGLGGTEAELLPTVYAGGFEGSSVGTGASLTIANATSKTVFQDIYMGHGEGTDSKVPYYGVADLSLCTNVSVRGGIYTQENSNAAITVSGNGYLSDINFYGNSATAISVSQSTLYRAGIYDVGNVVLNNNSYMQLADGGLHNTTITNNSCVDFNSMTDVTISGDFTGGEYVPADSTDTRGVLVLNKEGSLVITGRVKGSTWFYTDNRNFAGDYLEKTYITAAESENGAAGFQLPESEAEVYEFIYEDGEWYIVPFGGGIVYPTVKEIHIVSQPVSVDIAKIRSDEQNPASEAPYCCIQWNDENGDAIDEEMVEELYLYGLGTVIGIKTQYWEDETCQDALDWGNAVMFVTSRQNPGFYYFYAGQESAVKSGDYTYLFCDEYHSEDLYTVADVRALGSKIKAQMKVSFYDSSKGESNPAVPGNDPEEPEEPEDPAPPVHVHDGGKTTVQKAVQGRNGAVITNCTSCGAILSKVILYAPAVMKLSQKTYSYNGKAKTPAVVIKDVNGNVLDARHYTVEYRANKNPGEATATVIFKGNYSGTMKATFRILPKKTSVRKVTAKKKSFVVSWKKAGSQISGYQVQYSTSKKFTKKKTKTVTVKGKKKTSKTIKRLKAKKKYYVRVRTYKTVKINGKSVKICSEWSKAKTVKTK
nr:fibronectin type III domain-containing protein [Lachnospiraceae bacterium]